MLIPRGEDPNLIHRWVSGHRGEAPRDTERRSAWARASYDKESLIRKCC